MGRRSRKRGGAAAAGPPETKVGARTEGPTRRSEPRTRPSPARRGLRPSLDERPKAPWHPVPLVEICVLLGLVLLVLGVLDLDSDRGRVLLLSGMALGSLGGLDTALREHFAGFRSHTTLLSALPGVFTAAALFFARAPWPAVTAGAALVFAAAFWALRRAFVRRARG